MNLLHTPANSFVLDPAREFSRSLIWEMQRRYYTERGVEAWRLGEVPHYVTSNPTIANCYAEIVLAFWRDRQRFGTHGEGGPQPLTICELGGGSGRFAFYFLSRLAQLCEQAGVRADSFRYVLTDIADSNLEFWRGHPRLAPFFANGVLDMARFDIDAPGELALRVGGGTVGWESLYHPLVVIANYVFDSVPQDLFHIADGRCDHSLASLTIDENPDGLNSAALFAKLRVHYRDQPLAGAPYSEPWLQRLLDDYARELNDTHVLFPATALRCLHRMANLSRQGLLVLSADKGAYRLEALEGKSAPQPVRHGSFSLPVNYHAFASYCEHGGGLALVPASHPQSINVIGLLMTADAAHHTETRTAYQRHVQEFGPDTFFTIMRHARQTIPQMSAADILAYLQLSDYDSHQFGRYLPRLQQIVPDFDEETRRDLVAAIEKVWAHHFPLGEDLDLANQIASLFYAMDDYPLALIYFARSNEIYGEDTGTLFNMAACHHLLGRAEQASALLQRLLMLEPENAEAADLLARLDAEAQARRFNSTALGAGS
jgi:tetratricopeptide (TPR) repeat protein